MARLKTFFILVICSLGLTSLRADPINSIAEANLIRPLLQVMKFKLKGIRSKLSNPAVYKAWVKAARLEKLRSLWNDELKVLSSAAYDSELESLRVTEIRSAIESLQEELEEVDEDSAADREEVEAKIKSAEDLIRTKRLPQLIAKATAQIAEIYTQTPPPASGSADEFVMKEIATQKEIYRTVLQNERREIAAGLAAAPGPIDAKELPARMQTISERLKTLSAERTRLINSGVSESADLLKINSQIKSEYEKIYFIYLKAGGNRADTAIQILQLGARQFFGLGMTLASLLSIGMIEYRELPYVGAYLGQAVDYLKNPETPWSAKIAAGLGVAIAYETIKAAGKSVTTMSLEPFNLARHFDFKERLAKIALGGRLYSQTDGKKILRDTKSFKTSESGPTIDRLHRKACASSLALLGH